MMIKEDRVLDNLQEYDVFAFDENQQEEFNKATSSFDPFVKLDRLTNSHWDFQRDKASIDCESPEWPQCLLLLLRTCDEKHDQYLRHQIKKRC